MTTTASAVNDGAYRGRRISWAAFYNLRPDLRPANDNKAIKDPEAVKTRFGATNDRG